MVLGVGVLILPLFLVIFSIYTMSIANLYIIIGARLILSRVKEERKNELAAHSQTLGPARISFGDLHPVIWNNANRVLKDKPLV